jgi:hypothetical protein
LRPHSPDARLLEAKVMTMQRNSTVVGVFQDRSLAQQAVNALRRAGFRDDQIGVASRGHDDTIGRTTDRSADASDNYAGEGAVTGVAAGAGIGALWGLGIMAGALPAIGPAIAGGTLAAILSSAAAGAAAAGVAGALVGLGVPREEADYYESEFHAGRTIVSVHAPGRENEAMAVIRQFGGYDAANRERTTPVDNLNRAGDAYTAGGSGAGHSTLDVPVSGEDVTTDPITGRRHTNLNE